MDNQDSQAPVVDATAAVVAPVDTPVEAVATAPVDAPVETPVEAPVVNDTPAQPTQNVSVADVPAATVGVEVAQDTTNALEDVATDAEKVVEADVVAPAEAVASEVANQAVTDVESAVKAEEPVVESQAQDVRSAVVVALQKAEAALGAAGSREMALIRTKLEEAQMWAEKLLQKKPQ